MTQNCGHLYLVFEKEYEPDFTSSANKSQESIVGVGAGLSQ